MIRPIAFLTLLLPALTAFSQQPADVTTRVDSVRASLAHYNDSLNRIASLQWLNDSLTINTWVENMRKKVTSAFTTDSLNLQNKIDSISSIGLSPEPYASRLDSLLQRKQNLLAEVNGTQQRLLNQTKSKLESWRQKVQSRLDSLNISGVVPGVNLPKMNELSLPDIPSLTAPDFALPELSPDLALLNHDLGFRTSEGLLNIQSNLPGMKQVNGLRNFIGDPAATAEAAVGELDAVEKLQEQMKGPDDLPLPASEQEAQAIVIDKAIDHFAGQEDKLKAAMQQVAKYKQKYPSVQSIKDIAKKSQNAMKDKPFTERLVPGISFQYQVRNSYLLDINLYTGYRVTGRISTGIGWNQRLARFKDNSDWNHKAFIYGPRAFANYKLSKGFSVHLEVETMNAFVPYNLSDPQAGQRDWVWSTMTGIKKEYRVTKNIKGTVLVLYNLYDPRHRSPYNDRLNTRFGFEYSIKKK